MLHPPPDQIFCVLTFSCAVWWSRTPNRACPSRPPSRRRVNEMSANDRFPPRTRLKSHRCFLSLTSITVRAPLRGRRVPQRGLCVCLKVIVLTLAPRGGPGTVGGGQGVPGLAEVCVGGGNGQTMSGSGNKSLLAVRSPGSRLGPAAWKPLIADRKQNCAWLPLWKRKLGQNPKIQKCLLNNHENSNEEVRMLITVDELVC